VVAGVLTDARGQVMLAQRPAGTHYAGFWEFPGGKIEAGESAVEALRRELREEIGIEVQAAEALIAIPWHYETKSILLEVYRITAFGGEPRAIQVQDLRWEKPADLRREEMPPADHPVIAALQLPPTYAISPEPGTDVPAFLARVDRVLDRGIRMVQLRAKTLPIAELATLALAVQARVRAVGGSLLLNGQVDLALQLGLDGVHLTGSQLASFGVRPVPADRWLGASCHNAAELAAAVRLGADFAVIGPVLSTASHPGAAALGWEAFTALVAESPIPVYALGGLALAHLARAQAAGAQGIAGISAFWN
jgi:8-oxo-dGTP diphosphatase